MTEDASPAAEEAAGQSLVPETDKAVREANDLLINWLRRTMGDDLNGKQIRAIAVTALQIIVPEVRAAAMLDLADAMADSPSVPPAMADAIRKAARNVLAKYVEVPNAGS